MLLPNVSTVYMCVLLPSTHNSTLTDLVDTMDMLNCVKLPGHKLVIIEKSELLQRIRRLPGFVPYPESELLPLSAAGQRERPPSQVATPSRAQSPSQFQASGKQTQGTNSASHTVSESHSSPPINV